MTPCASPQFKIIAEDLSKSIIVSKGRKNSSNRSSAQSQSQPTSPRGDTTQINMVGVDNTLSSMEFG
jgi:hypothetical protein